VVGPDDVAQALLEGAVAAMGVGVEALHQRLVLRLDARRVRAVVKAKRVEGALDDAGVALALRRLGGPAPRVREALAAQDAERVEIGPVAAGRLRLAGLALRGGVHAHGEGRAVADDRVL